MAAPGTTTELGVTHLAAESVSGQTNVSLASRGSFAKVASLCLNSTCQETIATMMEMSGKDASWILTSAVIIFTMQTGFGLLESGCVSAKNEVNIMVKNMLDVVFGGITYWAVGFGLSFGTGPGTNPFVGVGYFLFDCDDETMGYSYALFLFQLSFSTTATTIVSGAMAERAKLSTYILFSFVNTLIYCIPAHWVWAESGFLYQMGVIDVAGCGPVHLVGGTTGLVATLMLGPRQHAFESGQEQLQAPLKAILGMFMLWAAVNTIVASMGGGIVSVLMSLLLSGIFHSVRYDVGMIINGILGSLVSITSMCTICRPWEALVAGGVGAALTGLTTILVRRLRVDDPVGVIAVHGTSAIWGLLCVGLFLEPEYSPTPNNGGALKTGQFYQLGVQTLTAAVIFGWTLITSSLVLAILKVTVGLRVPLADEEIGADILEHGIIGVFAQAVEAKWAVDTVLENGGQHNSEFKGRINHLLLEMVASCARNDITLTLANASSNSVTFELKFIDKAPSVDSGVDMVHM